MSLSSIEQRLRSVEIVKGNSHFQFLNGVNRRFLSRWVRMSIPPKEMVLREIECDLTAPREKTSYVASQSDAKAHNSTLAGGIAKLPILPTNSKLSISCDESGHPETPFSSPQIRASSTPGCRCTKPRLARITCVSSAPVASNLITTSYNLNL